MNIEREDLLAISKEMNIKKANSIIDEIGQIMHNWKSYADQTKVDSALKKAINSTLRLL